ncbi:unnamed protein product [Meloidogyne enterolobii]|uniref:Uncharacterized protein n=1 Tax=Meloidogyne enterolobii TaxID=390850 RepID=A0ACB0XVK0_MELEN
MFKVLFRKTFFAKTSVRPFVSFCYFSVQLLEKKAKKKKSTQFLFFLFHVCAKNWPTLAIYQIRFSPLLPMRIGWQQKIESIQVFAWQELRFKNGCPTCKEKKCGKRPKTNNEHISLSHLFLKISENK